jgi:hypothetical protein
VVMSRYRVVGSLRVGWVIVTSKLGCFYEQVGMLLRAGWVVVTSRLGCCYEQVGLLLRAGWFLLRAG